MLLIDRREFLTLGGFDERFFLYYEDRELSRRYRTAGLPIRTTEALTGRHEGGASSANDGLYVAPMTWSFLGWVQFLYLKEGERSARRAARAALKTLRAMRLGLRALYLVAPRWKRLGRKSEQIEELLAAVHSAAEDRSREFCPDALRLLGRPDVRPVTGKLP
jgi:GT2 family glycosyltransferase